MPTSRTAQILHQTFFAKFMGFFLGYAIERNSWVSGGGDTQRRTGQTRTFRPSWLHSNPFIDSVSPCFGWLLRMLSAVLIPLSNCFLCGAWSVVVDFSQQTRARRHHASGACVIACQLSPCFDLPIDPDAQASTATNVRHTVFGLGERASSRVWGGSGGRPPAAIEVA